MITVHELGHLYAAYTLKFKIDKIVIFPFGGNTKYNALLNTPIYKELIVLLSGPLFQIIFYLVIYILYINQLVSDNTFKIVEIINYSLLIFNFLPIVPLDGSKLLNLFLDYLIPYKKAHIITIVISIITVVVSVILNFKLIYIFLSILLIKSIILEIYNHKFKIKKFLLERVLYKLKLKQGKPITKVSNIKREKTHKIVKGSKVYNEREYLKNLFDLNEYL